MSASEVLTSPFVEIERAAWSKHAQAVPLPLTGEELKRLRSLGDEIDLDEVREVYLPLARLITLHFEAIGNLHAAYGSFFEGPRVRTPFILGIAGSVSVGKSTISRLLRLLLTRSTLHPRVELVTTDGFLFPNAELERRGLMRRKGFPESYDRRALLRFIMDVKAGHASVTAPAYSHVVYDILPDETLTLSSPDILILEGLNVLQPAAVSAEGAAVAVSDFIDFSVYVDATPDDIERWYVERFLKLRETAFQDPSSYFHRYAAFARDEAVNYARTVWREINGPNLESNIAPTRERATLVLVKDHDHGVSRIRVRKP